MRVTTVGVVGAGAMGSGIAALAASAGCRSCCSTSPAPTLIAVRRAQGRPAEGAQGQARRVHGRARSRACARGNTEDHLELLADCDWIVEAIIEQPAPKQALFARLEPLLKPSAIVAIEHLGHPDVGATRRTLASSSVAASSARTSSIRRATCTCSS